MVHGENVRSVVQHSETGDLYILEEEPIWSEDGRDCIGGRIVQAAGPIVRHDLCEEETWIEWVTAPDSRSWTHAEIESHIAVFDRIDRWPSLDRENAEWLQTESDAGQLTYPIGAR